jgi:hypothetical protein
MGWQNLWYYETEGSKFLLDIYVNIDSRRLHQRDEQYTFSWRTMYIWSTKNRTLSVTRVEHVVGLSRAVEFSWHNASAFEVA